MGPFFGDTGKSIICCEVDPFKSYSQESGRLCYPAGRDTSFMLLILEAYPRSTVATIFRYPEVVHTRTYIPYSGSCTIEVASCPNI